MNWMPLDFAPAGSWVALRGLSGRDEESVVGTDTEQAVRLLDRLLVDAPGAALKPGQAPELATPDRDRLLAEVHKSEFGPRINCTLQCSGCGNRFDMDFVLAELVDSLRSAKSPEGVTRNDEGILQLADGRRVRMPRGSDELALIRLPPDAHETELLRRCLIEGAASPGDAAVMAAMEAAGPLVDIELDAACPECAAVQQVHFDLQHYLLTAIMQESRQRVGEIHLLAAAYGWNLDEILGLTRKRRQAFAAEIERDRPPRRRGWDG
jgi:hypothetical protein